MLAPNTLLQNRYLVIRSIGQGGMGAVYLAKDQRLGNTVALKETFFTDARMRKAFEREARLLAHLRHTALPKVIDHFDEDDGQFLVMEFIAGDDLEVLLAQRGEPFDVPRILRWADQLLDALEYLHTQETPILHRDIKPANLKLTSRDQIILLDFGLAKGGIGHSTGVATSRSVLGYTPNFAPLEQIQGTGTDPRSDLYALGATLYYLMTGVIPANAIDRATASVSELPDPMIRVDEIDPRIDSAIADVLHQAVALNPSRRPATAAEMREALAKASSALTRNDKSEATTPVIDPTVVSLSTTPVVEDAKTFETNPLSVPDPRLVSRKPLDPTIDSRYQAAILPGPQPVKPPDPTPQKPNRLPWIVAGVVALLLIGIAITYFAFKSGPNSSVQWVDSEANREADRAAGVAARVNGKPIMVSDVDKSLNQQMTKDQVAKLTPLELKQANLQSLDKLIEQEVLFQRAERDKLLPSEDEITQYLNKQKQDSQMTNEVFEQRLKEQGLTIESLRNETRKALAIQRLQEKNTHGITISDQEVVEAFNNNKDAFVNKRGVELAAIVVDPSDNGMGDDAKSEAEAKQKIDRLYSELQNDEQFENVARTKSEDSSSATNGGDIGYATETDLKQNNFPSSLISQLMNTMNVGSYTAPVTFGNKWYIFKLKRRQLTDEVLTLDSPGVRQRIVETLTNQRKELANATLLTTVKNESKIVNYMASGTG